MGCPDNSAENASTAPRRISHPVRLDPSATTLVLGMIRGKVFGGICRHPEMHDEEELSEPVQFSALDSERA